MNHALGELIAAYQEGRIAKALEDIRSERRERLAKSMDLNAEVLEEHRRWARYIRNTGAGRLVIRKSAFRGGNTMNATMVEQAGALDKSLGELDGMIKSMDERDAQRLAKAQGKAPEGRPVTRSQALNALVKAVQSGAVSEMTASKVEDRLNNGTIAPSTIMKALGHEARMRKSKTETTVVDAQRALQRAFEVQAISGVEWQTGMDCLADGRSTPQEVFESLTPRIEAKTRASQPFTPPAPEVSVSDGKHYDRLIAHQEAFKANPLGATFR
jgi:hypothetical protein